MVLPIPLVVFQNITLEHTVFEMFVSGFSFEKKTQLKIQVTIALIMTVGCR